jgi:tetratricopeptide (TPR) repeat protein
MAWAKFPYPDPSYDYTAAGLKKAWKHLHAGDAEPFPKDESVLGAWIAFHAGEFEQAARLGRKAEAAGLAVVSKATCIYANYLEKTKSRKLALFEQVAAECERQQAEQPENPAAFYWHAYALGRYSQSFSVVKAMAEGIATRVKFSLDATLALSPRHADAHIAMGVYHAEIIDKAGALVAGLAYGASKGECIKHFEKALELNRDSAIARVEYANALVLLEGKKKADEAIALCQEAASLTARDAMERLDVELAREELEE